MTSVSPLELGRRIVEALGIQPGQEIELSRLRNGALLLSKLESEAESPGPQLAGEARVGKKFARQLVARDSDRWERRP